jgi:hypothetical protein
MRAFPMCLGLALLAGCAKPEPKVAAADSTAANMAAAVPAPISLSDVAGKWTMRAMGESSDSVLLTYDMVATADGAGWTLTFPGHPTIPARVVATAGDSIVVEAGPYASVLRKGVQVNTHSVLRLEAGNLVGTTVAHYTTTGADSVLNLRMQGTRAP